MKRLVTFLATTLAIASPVARAAAPHPNIIVILVDDMGFSDLGCYGSGDSHAEPRCARGRGAAIHAVLQHGPLLPHAGVVAHRACIRIRPASGT